MKMTKSIVVAAALVLSGCASDGPRYTDMKASYPALSANQGRIFFYRSSSVLGTAIQPDIRLNGAIVGKAVPGGYFYRDVPAGNYTVATSTEADRQLTFTMVPQGVRYVRISSSGDSVGRTHPELVSAEAGQRELADMRYSPPR